MTMKLAALDMETLDLGMRCQVFDVALVVAVLNDDFSVTETRADKFRLDQLEQMKLGRTVSRGTIEFHEKQQGAEVFRKHLDRPRGYETVNISECFATIRKACDSVDEVWINGLSFDSAILQSLGVETNDTKPLWFFRKERDVRTIRETNTWVYRETDRKTAAHLAYEDALWNLEVAAAYYRWLSMIPVKYRR